MNAVLYQNALQAQRAGNSGEAARLCEDLLRSDPDNPDALTLLGSLFFKSGRYGEAEQRFAAALKRNPRSIDALHERGRALQRLQRFDEAIACFEAVLGLNPVIVEAMFEIGKALVDLRRPEDAVVAFDRAIARNPNIGALWNARGMALMRVRNFDAALASYDKALAFDRNASQLWNNRGNALAALGRMEEALQCYATALTFPEVRPGVLNNRAKALFELSRFEESAQDYAALLQSAPEFPYASGNLVFSRLNCCDWRNLEKSCANVSADIQAGSRAISPGAFAAFCRSAEEQLLCGQILVADICPPSPTPLWQGERYRHDKIRIAYLSAEFRIHAVSTLAAGMYEQHDRNRFETIALSCGPGDGSPMRRRLESAFDRFIDVCGRSDRELAQLMREMEIDIAVDLMGLSRNSRAPVFAMRPAPVQVNFVAFPGTLGASYIDYIVADRIAIPEQDRRFFSEQVVYLPDSFMPTDSRRRIAMQIPSRREAGLPEDGFVFCSFNNNFKIMPDMFDIWMRLLLAVERSVFWLPRTNAAAVANLRREAEARGVAGERLLFAPYVATGEEHLARLGLADLFLDMLPYNAHSTTADALWAGLPLLTCLGETFASRVAGSLLYAAGLPELVTRSLEAYEAMALHLARDKAALAEVRAKLHRSRKTAPLFDTARYTRHLEAAYTVMWQRTQAGQKPISFAVEHSAP